MTPACRLLPSVFRGYDFDSMAGALPAAITGTNLEVI
jgi:hypothetical protein